MNAVSAERTMNAVSAERTTDAVSAERTIDAAPARNASRLVPRFAARAAGYDGSGEFPVDNFADLRAARFFGLIVPARLGGPGAGDPDLDGGTPRW